MTRALLYMCALLPLTGCVFYSSDDDGCDWGGGEGARAAPDLRRNPDTGQCEEVGYGGGGGGGGGCGDAPLMGDAERAPAPDWGTCDSQCSGLDELTCLATAGCRGAFIDTCPAGADCGTADTTSFYECWSVAPQAPLSTGECFGLDAYECSRHDNCEAIHGIEEAPPGAGDQAPGFVQAIGGYRRCEPEPTGCYGDADCGDGTSCNADELCLPAPGCGGGAGEGDGQAPCPAVCYGYCVPDAAPVDHCYGEVACDALPPECAEGTRPGIYGSCWSGACIPVAECPEGSCEGEPSCELVEPTCPEGTTPGVSGSCWTGYCIPLDQCDGPPPACAELDEVGCIARVDCAPYYEGVDCDCSAGECVCQDWLFQSCQGI